MPYRKKRFGMHENARILSIPRVAGTLSPAAAPFVPTSMHDLSSPASGLFLHDVCLRRGNRAVFEQLSLSLTEHRIGIIGDNGAGKSSLLRLLCGLDAPQAGEVVLHPQAPDAPRVSKVGMMFQNPDDQIIFPTVVEELALGLQPRGIGKRAAQARALAFLDERGLASWAERTVSSLSQGQRQQVCWLALLLAAPSTLLLDEPYASLDLMGQAQLADDIAACDHQIVVSTHTLAHVRDYPRVIWLDAGQVRGDGTGEAICAAYEADVAHRIATRRRTRAAAVPA